MGGGGGGGGGGIGIKMQSPTPPCKVRQPEMFLVVKYLLFPAQFLLLKNTKNRNLSCILIHHFRVLISFLFFSSGFSCQQKIVECLPDHLSY